MSRIEICRKNLLYLHVNLLTIFSCSLFAVEGKILLLLLNFYFYAIIFDSLLLEIQFNCKCVQTSLCLNILNP